MKLSARESVPNPIRKNFDYGQVPNFVDRLKMINEERQKREKKLATINTPSSGLWISPDGQEYTALPDHNRFAEKTIKSFFPEYDASSGIDEFDYFLNKGWIRNHNDSFVLEEGSVKNLKDYLLSKRPYDNNLWIDIYNGNNLIKSLHPIDSKDFIEMETRL